jgi:hypothetical protein
VPSPTASARFASAKARVFARRYIGFDLALYVVLISAERRVRHPLLAAFDVFAGPMATAPLGEPAALREKPELDQFAEPIAGIGNALTPQVLKQEIFVLHDTPSPNKTKHHKTGLENTGQVLTKQSVRVVAFLGRETYSLCLWFPDVATDAMLVTLKNPATSSWCGAAARRFEPAIGLTGRRFIQISSQLPMPPAETLVRRLQDHAACHDGADIVEPPVSRVGTADLRERCEFIIGSITHDLDRSDTAPLVL